jgi:hypothetical protein
MPKDPANIVARAIKLWQEKGIYPRGCSDFVCVVLGIGWENANSLLALEGTEIAIGNFVTIGVGSILGWPNPGGNGHVAVYVNQPTFKFIDVQSWGPQAHPRTLNGYGNQKIYLSNRFGFCL